MKKTITITNWQLIDLIACFFFGQKARTTLEKTDRISRKTTIIAGHNTYRGLANYEIGLTHHFLRTMPVPRQEYVAFSFSFVLLVDSFWFCQFLWNSPVWIFLGVPCILLYLLSIMNQLTDYSIIIWRQLLVQVWIHGFNLVPFCILLYLTIFIVLVSVYSGNLKVKGKILWFKQNRHLKSSINEYTTCIVSVKSVFCILIIYHIRFDNAKHWPISWWYPRGQIVHLQWYRPSASKLKWFYII